MKKHPGSSARPEGRSGQAGVSTGPGAPPRWSAEQAAAASRDFAELHAAHGGLLWVEFDPQQARCGLWFYRDGQRHELTPPGYSVRSRVYEYGGGACCPTAAGVAFVNEADQQVYLLTLAGGDGDIGAPCAVTARLHCRYGELSYVPAWQTLLAVEESHEAGGVIHRLVRLGLDGSRRVLVEGADFYAGAVASVDGEQLAWIEWNRPEQPWTATRLCLRLGATGETLCLAGMAGDESLQQPRFDALGRLFCLSDRDGWWQPYAWRIDGGTCPSSQPSLEGRGRLRSQTSVAYLPPASANPLSLRERVGVREGPLGIASQPADHAAAPWQLGGRTYLPLEHGELLLTRFEQGFGVLAVCDAAGHERRLADHYSRFRALATDDSHYYGIAASPTRLPAVLAISRDSGAVQVLAGGEQPLPGISPPRAFSYVSGAEERAHGFFHAPPGQSSPAPLVVFLHGGPTSACYPVFDPRIPFWTERGFAVADLNYRGSSGYGRAYRQRLQGEWGRSDVEDIQAAIAHLAALGLVDADRVFVRGASAGGFSALMALAHGKGLRGGASLYGVSDPLALRRATHKFEADYLDWLIGDPQRDAGRYAARTPLRLAGRIEVPMIFFQGGQDAVVVPAQTESMVAALRQRGIRADYHLYPDERHGFRQAAHVAEVLERELAFYQELLAEQ
ncbi:S9 family peptidase [Pseudomonas sp. PDM14]|uniref:alpha/beta hydrolase family protein n=1 Tax=Pseudomonas sp. PDM14 TaxID=2769288 RepID=UPI0017876097|nr:S9 family peptidase [Pseudomonas sp. PDM14]MBD9481477.1 S9 family peptidase [Pseudomonas sp. PDM14]